MSTLKLLAVALLAMASSAHAAPAEYIFVDHSAEILIDKASALAVWKAQADDSQRARVQKLYPPAKWGFISQVSGGFTEDKVCVVTARAQLVPRVRGDRLVFEPHKTATAFASQAGATREQCRELAAVKLKEAVLAVRSSLIAP